MTNYVHTIIQIFQAMGALATIAGLLLIAVIAAACISRFSARPRAWESYRILLYAKHVYTCLVMLLLAKTGFWLAAVYDPAFFHIRPMILEFVLLLLLALLGPLVMSMLESFDRSITSGKNYLLSIVTSVTGKCALALSISGWLHLVLLNLLGVYPALRGIELVASYLIVSVMLWTAMLMINDRWVNYYLHSATPGAIHHNA